jgi:uncharacterized protein (TIGR00266 family)
MQIEVLYRPAMAMARVQLAANEQIRAEAGAMIGMSTHVQMQTGMTGGLGGGLKRMFGGESFFQNTFTAAGAPGEVLLAHALPGDINVVDVPQTGLFIQSTSYIAGHTAVQVATQVGGFKTFFGGEGLFVLKAEASGPGQPVIIGAFGGMQEMVCNGSLVIDNGHLVAWETTLDYKIVKSGSGLIASFLSGEGMVFEFSGHGRIWIQTRNPGAFGQTVGRMLPPV